MENTVVMPLMAGALMCFLCPSATARPAGFRGNYETDKAVGSLPVRYQVRPEYRLSVGQMVMSAAVFLRCSWLCRPAQRQSARFFPVRDETRRRRAGRLFSDSESYSGSQERDRRSRAQLTWHWRVSRSPDEAWAAVDRYEQTWFLHVWR